MRTKAFALVVFILTGAAAQPLWADQLTQIGIIDLSKIISSYFEASYALREIDDMTKKFEADKTNILTQIQNLEQQKLAAQSGNNQQLALQLDDQIFKQRNYLQEFIRIRINQISSKRDSLMQSPTFLSDLVKAVAYVAENQGYSIVLRNDDPYIMYWNKEVDITDKVIDRLKQISTNASS